MNFGTPPALCCTPSSKPRTCSATSATRRWLLCPFAPCLNATEKPLYRICSNCRPKIAICALGMQHKTPKFMASDVTGIGRGLLMLVGQRRRLLKYLRVNHPDRYKSLIERLGLRR